MNVNYYFLTTVHFFANIYYTFLGMRFSNSIVYFIVAKYNLRVLPLKRSIHVVEFCVRWFCFLYRYFTPQIGFLYVCCSLQAVSPIRRKTRFMGSATACSRPEWVEAASPNNHHPLLICNQINSNNSSYSWLRNNNYNNNNYRHIPISHHNCSRTSI